jgi:hypothetical protein
MTFHHYPEPIVPPAEENRAIVLGEFGGLGLALEGHTWEQKNWGYRNMQDTLELLSKYELFYDMVHQFNRENGLSAAIYTQTTDVETETNGLLTYDRKINKIGIGNVYNANHNFIPPFLISSDSVFTENYVAELKNNRPGGTIYYTIDGSVPDTESSEYTGSLKLKSPATIKAFTKWTDGKSRVISYEIKR